MSYQTRKYLPGQEVVKKLTFRLNKCRYTAPPYATENRLFANTGSPISAATTGISIPVGQIGGSSWLSTWSGMGDLYGQVASGEIIRFQAVNATTIFLVARGQFGSTAQSINPNNGITIYHTGYFDGSCYGYSQTCSSPNSYQSGLYKDVVFSSAPLPAGSVYHGGLSYKDIRYQSSEIKPGETIGTRSRISFSLKDQKHNDYDLVYYDDRRTEQGTLFGKLLARHPYFNGRPVIYSVGLRDAGSMSEPEWEDRTLIIDDVNLDGETFSGSALDPLILTEGKKAKMPIASPAQLTAAITSGSTSITFGNAPAGYFGTSGTIVVRIDSELIRVTANGTTTMPIVERGFGRSQVKDHAVNATVQNCIRFQGIHVVNAIVYAIQTWTTIPASYLGGYAQAIADNPTAIISDYTLSTPMDVVEFINRCILIGNLVFYFDDVTQKIVIKYVSEFNLSPIYINETDHIRKDSARKDLNLKEQYTRFNMSWAPYDRTKETDQVNYQVSLTAINVDMESPNKIGEVNERKAVLMPILNESANDYTLGASVVNRVVEASEQIPEIFECELDAESVGAFGSSTLELGAIVNIQSSENQDKAGVGEARLYQVVRIEGDPFAAFKVKFKRYQVIDPGGYDFVIEPGEYLNYVLSSNFSISDPGIYTIYIKQGTVFGSYNTNIAAFDTGSYPSGITLKVINRGQILGMGGAGGNSGYSNSINGAPGLEATNGLAGGLALELRVPTTLDNAAGLIWAGGGGGGAETSQNAAVNTWTSASGGGGGQGYGQSNGGSYRTGAIPAAGAPPGVSGSSNKGSQSAPGSGGLTVEGGLWGQDGDSASSLGGIAGIAIKSNGNSVTITSGDNPLSIRGRRT